ncbi:hypothetical protein ACQ4PT_057404 [Festuca glaucescens]
MGTRDIPLPVQLAVILGKGTRPPSLRRPSDRPSVSPFDSRADRDRWPLEARFIEAAHDGDVRTIKSKAPPARSSVALPFPGGPPLARSGGLTRSQRSWTCTAMGSRSRWPAPPTWASTPSTPPAAGGRLPLYQYLVEEVKMDINKPDTSQDCSPTEHAIAYGNLPAVAYLLDHGADLHLKRRGNVTLLHSAAIHGHCEIVKFLLSRGADVDALSVTGTPLSVASFKGHASTVKILLQHNADVLFKIFFDLLAFNFNSLFAGFLLHSPIAPPVFKGITGW